MKNKLNLLPIIILLSLTLTSCSSEKPEEVVVLTPVETTSLQLGSIDETLTYSGQIKPAQSINIVSKLTAKVSNTYKEVGDFVNSGDVLFELDRQDVENQIKQLQAQLDATTAQMESGIISTESSLTNAKNSLDLATTSYENAKILYDAGSISKSEYDSAELQYNQATTAYNNAKTSLEQQVNSYGMTTNQGNANIAGSSKSAIATQLEIAKQSRNDLLVRSPISGTVSYKGVQKGEFASPNSLAYTVVNMDSVIVETKVSEMLINNIQINDEVEVYINAMGDEPYVGVVSEITPVADQTSTYPIKITISNEDHLIKPGMFSSVTFTTNSNNDTIIVPRSTVITSQGVNYVYIVDGDTAVRVEVDLGIDTGEFVEITNGLNVGDEVITNGQTYVSDGEKVNIVSKN